jgi:hypothetical protein
MKRNVIIRAATADDIPEILRQRKLIYEDMGHAKPEALSRMVSTSLRILNPGNSSRFFPGMVCHH